MRRSTSTIYILNYMSTRLQLGRTFSSGFSSICHRLSPQNENLNLLELIFKLKNFLEWSENVYTFLGPDDRCSLWGL
jgi:hypothetical protein